jgi:hypothetical protein
MWDSDADSARDPKSAAKEKSWLETDTQAHGSGNEEPIGAHSRGTQCSENPTVKIEIEILTDPAREDESMSKSRGEWIQAAGGGEPSKWAETPKSEANCRPPSATRGSPRCGGSHWARWEPDAWPARSKTWSKNWEPAEETHRAVENWWGEPRCEIWARKTSTRLKPVADSHATQDAGGWTEQKIDRAEHLLWQEKNLKQKEPGAVWWPRKWLAAAKQNLDMGLTCVSGIWRSWMVAGVRNKNHSANAPDKGRTTSRNTRFSRTEQKQIKARSQKSEKFLNKNEQDSYTTT